MTFSMTNTENNTNQWRSLRAPITALVLGCAVVLSAAPQWNQTANLPADDTVPRPELAIYRQELVFKQNDL
jgi:hypothetical protein